MDTHIGGRALQTRGRQRMLDSVSERLASHYASLTAASSGSQSAVYGRENRARSQSDYKTVLGMISGRRKKKTVN